MGVTGTRLESICLRENLPDTDGFGALVEAAVTAMEQTDSCVRPRDTTGRAGGLLYLTESIPTILVPDLHARRDFFFNCYSIDFPVKRPFSKVLERERFGLFVLEMPFILNNDAGFDGLLRMRNIVPVIWTALR